MSTEYKFDHRFPFTTKAGWPARLVGVLQRRAYPLVVAVSNPAFDMAEEVHCYDFDGRQPMRVVYATGEVTSPHEGAVDGMMSLVNIEESGHLLIRKGTWVHTSVIPMEPIPAGSNPFHYDGFSMGTDLVRGWMVMHDGFTRKDTDWGLPGMYLVNVTTGQRITLKFSPATPEAVAGSLSPKPV